MILRKSSDVSFSEDEMFGLAAVKVMSGGSFILSDDLIQVSSGKQSMHMRRRLLQQLLPITGTAAVAVDALGRDIPEILRLCAPVRVVSANRSGGGGGGGSSPQQQHHLASTVTCCSWGEKPKSHHLHAVQIFGRDQMYRYMLAVGRREQSLAHVNNTSEKKREKEEEEEASAAETNIANAWSVSGTLHAVDLRSGEHTCGPLPLTFVVDGSDVYDCGWTSRIVPPHGAAIFFLRWIPDVDTPGAVYLGSTLHYSGYHEVLSLTQPTALRGVVVCFRRQCLRRQRQQASMETDLPVHDVAYIFLRDTDAQSQVTSTGPAAMSDSAPELVTVLKNGAVWRVSVTQPVGDGDDDAFLELLAK